MDEVAFLIKLHSYNHIKELDILLPSLSLCKGQPPPVLSLAYRAVRMDNPRQLKEHLTVIGETVLRSPEGAELLGEACECGSDGCVRVLLDSGCCPDTTGRADGMSALHLAAQSDHARCDIYTDTD